MREVDYERILDARIMARLKTDRAYLNAADAEEQADREWEIEREEVDRLDAECPRELEEWDDISGAIDEASGTVYSDADSGL